MLRFLTRSGFVGNAAKKKSFALSLSLSLSLSATIVQVGSFFSI